MQIDMSKTDLIEMKNSAFVSRWNQAEPRHKLNEMTKKKVESETISCFNLDFWCPRIQSNQFIFFYISFVVFCLVNENSFWWTFNIHLRPFCFSYDWRSDEMGDQLHQSEIKNVLETMWRNRNNTWVDDWKEISLTNNTFFSVNICRCESVREEKSTCLRNDGQ